MGRQDVEDLLGSMKDFGNYFEDRRKAEEDKIEKKRIIEEEARRYKEKRDYEINRDKMLDDLKAKEYEDKKRRWDIEDRQWKMNNDLSSIRALNDINANILRANEQGLTQEASALKQELATQKAYGIEFNKIMAMPNYKEKLDAIDITFQRYFPNPSQEKIDEYKNLRASILDRVNAQAEKDAHDAKIAAAELEKKRQQVEQGKNPPVKKRIMKVFDSDGNVLEEKVLEEGVSAGGFSDVKSEKTETKEEENKYSENLNYMANQLDEKALDEVYNSQEYISASNILQKESDPILIEKAKKKIESLLEKKGAKPKTTWYGARIR
jgi:hypothetical protein